VHLAFLAMTLFRTGALDAALTKLAELRTLMDDEAIGTSKIARAVFAEANGIVVTPTQNGH
jgi:hypothetical protein